MKIENKLFSIIENTISNYDIIDSFDRETVFSELLNFSKPVSNEEDVFKMYFVLRYKIKEQKFTFYLIYFTYQII